MSVKDLNYHIRQKAIKDLENKIKEARQEFQTATQSCYGLVNVVIPRRELMSTGDPDYVSVNINNVLKLVSEQAKTQQLETLVESYTLEFFNEVQRMKNEFNTLLNNLEGEE